MLLCDFTDDPADWLFYLSMHPSPNGIVMSPRTFYLSVIDRFWREPSLKGLLPDLSPRGDTEAGELLGAGFPLPYGDEEGQGDARGGLGLWQVRALSEHNWVFCGWRGDNSS